MREAICLALVHYPTVDREGEVVATAVTTLDLHDLSRLARTYGLGGVYATSPLPEQRQLVARLMAHWVDGHGGRVNPSRREALESLRVVEGLAEAAQHVTERWGSHPLIVGTSARPGPNRVAFSEARQRLREGHRPGLLVFGTGWGLAPAAIDLCDWVIEPIRGPGPYNHLSVRSAASIVVDRLFGEG